MEAAFYLSVMSYKHKSTKAKPKTLSKEVFGDLWTENWGAPKTPNPTTTDVTPHLRPSDFQFGEMIGDGEILI